MTSVIQNSINSDRVTILPELTRSNLDDIMKDRLSAVTTPTTSIPILWQGFLETHIRTQGNMRKIKIYIPRNTRQTATFILMNTPGGEDAVSFILESGWKNAADLYETGIVCVEPAETGWAVPELEIHTFLDCMKVIFSGVHSRVGMTIYAVGYGDGGAALHRAILCSPLQTAAAAFINASNIPSSYIDEVSSHIAGAPNIQSHVTLAEIPVPVWIIENSSRSGYEYVFRHWVKSSAAEFLQNDPVLGAVYLQNKKCMITPEGNISKICLQKYVPDIYSPAFSKQICRFLVQYSRYGKQSPYGNSLVRRVNYDASGVSIHYYTDQSGIRREWLVYVPKAYTGIGKLPLIIGFHGACESIRAYFEQSQLQHLADEKGLIIVMPEASLNPVPEQISPDVVKAYRSIWNFSNPELRYAELDYYSKVLDELLKLYPIDGKRMYLTGHSMGCMMINFIASSFLGKRFAAAAGTSGHAYYFDIAEKLENPEQARIWDMKNTSEESVPIMLNMGQYDLWSSNPRSGKEIAFTIDSWLVRDRITWSGNAAEVRLNQAELYTDGRYHGYIWKDSSGIPWVRYERIDLKDHMNCAEDNIRFWNNWFSLWKFDEAGKRVYLFSHH